MKNFLRFAVVTAFHLEDWHSQRIADALSKHGDVAILDPALVGADFHSKGLRFLTSGSEGLFDAFVLARGMSSQGDADAQFCVYRALSADGALVINRLDALLDAQDKFRTSHLLHLAGIPTPRAAIVQSVDEAAIVLSALQRVVAKPLTGSLGEGVERLSKGRRGLERVAERLYQEKAIYLQEWVPNRGYDTRVLVVGGELSGAVERVATAGEFRTNIAQGAKPREARLSPEAIEIAQMATLALGLDYAGVDLLEGPSGLQVIEVNGNPAFDMIWTATGKDVALDIAGHVAAQARVNRVANRKVVLGGEHGRKDQQRKHDRCGGRAEGRGNGARRARSRVLRRDRQEGRRDS